MSASVIHYSCFILFYYAMKAIVSGSLGSCKIYMLINSQGNHAWSCDLSEITERKRWNEERRGFGSDAELLLRQVMIDGGSASVLQRCCSAATVESAGQMRGPGGEGVPTRTGRDQRSGLTSGGYKGEGDSGRSEEHIAAPQDTPIQHASHWFPTDHQLPVSFHPPADTLMKRVTMQRGGTEGTRHLTPPQDTTRYHRIPQAPTLTLSLQIFIYHHICIVTILWCWEPYYHVQA